MLGFVKLGFAKLGLAKLGLFAKIGIVKLVFF
jgi:hypothetical protein